jgi:hypothetical protein
VLCVQRDRCKILRRMETTMGSSKVNNIWIFLVAGRHIFVL